MNVETMTKVAFHGDHAIKAKYIARVHAHLEAGRLVQGLGWDEDEDGVFRGCAIGCTLEAYDHEQYEFELGIPEILARLQDEIFEGLTASEAMVWATRFLEATPVGADLSGVWADFAVWLMIDPEHGVIRHTEPGSDAHVAIRRVADFYAAGRAGDDDRGAVVEAASSAAGSAASVSYVSSASKAAWSAHWTARGAVGNAVGYAVISSAMPVPSGGEVAAWTAMADKLIDLIESSEVSSSNTVDMSFVNKYGSDLTAEAARLAREVDGDE